MPPIENLPPLNVAVFARELDTVLVSIDDAESSTTIDAALRSGCRFVGTIGVNSGVPFVHTEPGCGPQMVLAGYVFAGVLGEHLQQYQLAEQLTESGVN